MYSGRRKKASGKEDAPGTAVKGTKVRLPIRETHSAFESFFQGQMFHDQTGELEGAAARLE